MNQRIDQLTMQQLAKAEEKNETSKAELERIRRKAKSGKRLTAKEKSILKKEDKELYEKVIRVEKMREQFEQQLKSCDTKEEASRVLSVAMASANQFADIGEMLAGAYQDAYKEFTKTPQFKKMDDVKEAKNNRKLEYEIGACGYQEVFEIPEESINC